jgi:hypothetical protein
MKSKLTDAAIRSYESRPMQYAVGDTSCPCLCIRITPKGVKTFAFAYRNRGTGKVQWLTIGRYPDTSLARAREVANDARKVVAAGGTPLAPKAQRQLWRALDDPERLGIKPDAATALRLVLVTAARPGMVRGIVGDELRDLHGPSAHGPHWSLPFQRIHVAQRS